ncbi:MAG: hypothetical protein APG08_00163 [Candidatus Methanofastidiosum methylothiophilum]|jgi:cadmium resistance protein CadD (predicted permease)|uniref:Uncharacterized protein n=1 Tax=Candidatus Methanofastidiosum methylothiophilum TaxID=1705564 RepID=A0A150JMV1_9EURY|nr:MAG: hypothetical protein AN188_00200 [Candidatus Methanofastidiosum methylthiophilus]MBP6932011.1 hypothetical protein [Methanofastidiosum sp.]OQC52828.1 MAG: hypothetical protein BWX56_00065 [Euryarchaeota archaeon ADurb.Bin023]KYC57689.1 MAG: hypothetical protein APG08_00163 [Candidatus Methanofastidiosum methylthiophilus]KYC58421.1 MAG: hypothetical protein APG09_00163 [Candidatus Methanofastidiosum methylthiophilus]
MRIKATQIIGAIISIIGFILMFSNIFGYKLDFLPLKEGIFSLGLVTIVIGLIIAFKIPSDEEY